MASWDDYKNSSSEAEDEEGNLRLMINSDFKEVNLSNSYKTCKILENLFDNLIEDSKLLT